MDEIQSASLPFSDARIRQIISLIDLTNLNDDCDEDAIELLCKQATTPVGHVAALCVWPTFVRSAKTRLDTQSAIKIATVINFPSGNECVNECCDLVEAAINDGADEIDYVMPYQELIKGNHGHVRNNIKSIRSHTPSHIHLKVILESGVLDNSDSINTAAGIAIDEGADFIKTSTGKVPVNATQAAATTMLNTIRQSHKDVGFKAAGGIKTLDDANRYLALAEELMGQDWPDSHHFRLGASSLLQDALNGLKLNLY